MELQLLILFKIIIKKFMSNNFEKEINEKPSNEENNKNIIKLENENNNLIQSVNNIEYLYNKNPKKEIQEINIHDEEISKLKNQLLNEKKIREKEISNIYSRINKKEIILQSISSVNVRLEKKYNILKTKVNDLKKRNLSLNDKDDPIKLVLNAKEKERKDFQSKINHLFNENNSTQKILDKYSDIESKRQKTDQLLLMEKENNKLKEEIQTMKILLKDHKDCHKEKEDLENKVKNLEKLVNNSKKNNRNNELEYYSLEEKYYNSNTDRANKTKLQKQFSNEVNSLNLFNHNKNTFNTPFHFYKYNITTQNYDYYTQKNSLREPKKISIKSIIKTDYKLIDDKEKETLFNFFGEDKEKFDNFIKKIDKLEKYRNDSDNHNKKIKILENQNKLMDELEQKVNFLIKIDKAKDNQIKLLEAKIKEYKNNKNDLQKKINCSIKDLSFIKYKKESKLKELKSLTDIVNQLKETIKKNFQVLNNEKKLEKNVINDKEDKKK